jgi:hypothetical protein
VKNFKIYLKSLKRYFEVNNENDFKIANSTYKPSKLQKSGQTMQK